MESKDIQKRLAENLRKIRKNKKLTQFELAIKCDLSEAMIKNMSVLCVLILTPFKTFSCIKNRKWPLYQKDLQKKRLVRFG